MENFSFISPTEFVFGKNTEKEVGKYIKKYQGKKVLIHYGSGSIKRSGLLDRVKESLKAEGLEFVELGGVKPNPRSGLVYEGIDICKKENIDFILAVGGGSTIDSAKAIAIGALYDGDFWDFYRGKRVDRALKVATILTIAAAGSEASTGSVITHEDGMFKRSAGGDVMRPVFSILNPELTMTLPAFQTAAGITDMMAHLFERYFTNTKNVDLTDRLIEGILLSIIKAAPIVIKNPNDYEARATIMWAGMIAHNGITGVGREEDWASHQIEHELSALYDVAHGAGLATTFPAWMTYVYKNDVMRFARLFTNVFGVQMDFENPEYTVLRGIEVLKEFFTSIGMPINFKELGAKEEDIDYMANKACYGDGMGGTLGNFIKLKEEDIKNIYKLMI